MDKSEVRLSGIETNHLFEISEIITRSNHWKTALDRITQILRTIFIFDNSMVFAGRQATQ